MEGEETVTCLSAKTNWETNAATCKWTGSFDTTMLTTGNCAVDSPLYKGVYTKTIQCFQNALAYANGDSSLAPGGEASTTTSDTVQPNDTDTLWILLGGFLVFFMQTGFAALEVGACRSKAA